MNKFLYNNRVLRPRRQNLRYTQTEPEKILWDYLARKKFHGLRFCRQYSAGPYILDFYCPALRLAIELDGKSHETPDAKIYDTERTLYLQGLNIREIRFNNHEVVEQIELVLAKILACSPLK